MTTMPTYYIPHGGGPCFFMEWNPPGIWDAMGAALGSLAAGVGATPRAILVVSAHWEEASFSVMAQERPALLFDYFGFPEHTYRLTYPAPGSPALAGRVQALLAGTGQPVAVDRARGFDHGVFIPFKLIYPAAEIPIVQLSLKTGLDPAEHLAAGAALAPLRDEGVLIVGSGMSYHNMRGAGRGPGSAGEQFDRWLTRAVEADGDARQARLAAWAEAPGARIAHPREEHLLPLMVAAGAAGADRGCRVFNGIVRDVPYSAYRFG